MIKGQAEREKEKERKKEKEREERERERKRERERESERGREREREREIEREIDRERGKMQTIEESSPLPVLHKILFWPIVKWDYGKAFFQMNYLPFDLPLME